MVVEPRRNSDDRGCDGRQIERARPAPGRADRPLPCHRCGVRRPRHPVRRRRSSFPPLWMRSDRSGRYWSLPVGRACGPGNFSVTPTRSRRWMPPQKCSRSPRIVSTATGCASCVPTSSTGSQTASTTRFSSASGFPTFPWSASTPSGRWLPKCLKPGGRVFFVDDAYRTPDELMEGESSTTIRRRLNDGSAHRVVKVPHQPADLEQRLAALGWAVEVTGTYWPLYWGTGSLG